MSASVMNMSQSFVAIVLPNYTQWHVGGVASQEVIKILELMHQNVPLCNTYLYNAATCSSVTVCLNNYEQLSSARIS